MRVKDVAKKKDLIIQALAENPIVTTACKQAGVHRATHYAWLESDKNYKKRVDKALEATLDFAEQKLFELIEQGNVKAIIFFLKHRGESRGYTLSKLNGEININTTNNTINISGPIGELKRLQEEFERKKNVTQSTTG